MAVCVIGVFREWRYNVGREDDRVIDDYGEWG